MTTETREQLIGAVMLVLLVALMVFLNQTRDPQAGATGETRVEALFGQVDGLGLGAEVRMGGVRIGSVVDQRLDAGYRAVVTLGIDPGVSLPKDSSASVQTDGLFGGKFVIIEPGFEEETLASGDRITRTQDAQVVSEILDLIISEGRAALAERRAQAGQAK